jgi:dihydroorotase
MPTPSILLKGGRIIDPQQNLDQAGDLLIVDGKVAQVGRVDRSADETIDCTGLIVAPGLIDIHVHLREPGDEAEETIASGSAAAVAGGFTSIACMPNTDPALDSEAEIEFVYRQARRAGLCNVYPIGAVTKGREGKELAEMGQMVRAGAVGFSDDGCGVADTGTMLRALQYIAMFDKPLIQHCEDPTLSGGVMNAGYMSTKLGLPGLPAAAEEIMIQRDLKLLETAPAKYHVCHISTAGAVQLVREGKARGQNVTTEVCPHHLLLTEESCAGYDPNFKMSPPLRTAEDVDACIAGVVDGTIDCLITDHAPHGLQEKQLEFLYAPFGIIGLECSLALFIKALVTPGHLTWPQLIDRMTRKPAQVLSLDKGTLCPGVDADVTVIDPQLDWTIDINQFKSRSRNCPFHSWAVQGKAVLTLVAGQVKHSQASAAV